MSHPQASEDLSPLDPKSLDEDLSPPDPTSLYEQNTLREYVEWLSTTFPPDTKEPGIHCTVSLTIRTNDKVGSDVVNAGLMVIICPGNVPMWVPKGTRIVFARRNTKEYKGEIYDGILDSLEKGEVKQGLQDDGSHRWYIPLDDDTLDCNHCHVYFHKTQGWLLQYETAKYGVKWECYGDAGVKFRSMKHNTSTKFTETARFQLGKRAKMEGGNENHVVQLTPTGGSNNTSVVPTSKVTSNDAAEHPDDADSCVASAGKPGSETNAMSRKPKESKTGDDNLGGAAAVVQECATRRTPGSRVAALEKAVFCEVRQGDLIARVEKIEVVLLGEAQEEGLPDRLTVLEGAMGM